MRLFLACLALVLILPVAAQQDDEGARRTLAALEAKIKEQPKDATLYFYLARFRAHLGERAGAIEALQKVAELGEGFLPPRADGFETLWGDPDFTAVYAKLEAKLPRMDIAPVAFEMVDKTLLPEGLAYDAPSRSFFMGSIPQKRILRIGQDLDISDFATLGADLDYVLGLAVDSPRRTLYVVSTSALTTEGGVKRRNAVVAFDVDSRKLIKRYDVPAALQLNDVTVAPGGRVFTTDSGSGAVYEIAVKGPGPSREIVPPDELRGSNGIAASPDGKLLYVAHSTGIAVVDINTRVVKRMANATRENVAAIDGLYEHHGELIGVQNVTTPGRVILITLSKDGESITGVRTMLSHHHRVLDEPTTGAIAGEYFYLLAATGVTHFNRQGKIERLETLPSPKVLKVLLPH